MVEKTKGYMGKIIRIDLSSRRIDFQELDENTVRMVIGGTGLAAKILWEETDAATDPLGSENLICFFTGPCFISNNFILNIAVVFKNRKRVVVIYNKFH